MKYAIVNHIAWKQIF